MGGSFLEAPVDWVRRIGTTLRACGLCLTARRTMGLTNAVLGATLTAHSLEFLPNQ